MATTAFETPKLKAYPVIPLVQVGAMAHSKPYVAAAPIQKAIGFPGELVEDWHDKAIAKMGELLGKYRSLKVYMDACVHCGACSDKCHYFLGTGDPKNMPVARQDLMRKVYRRYFTFAGKHFPKLVGAEDLTRERAGRLVQLLQPVLGMPALLGVLPLRHRHRRGHHGRREIMDSIGMGQKYSNEIIGKVHKIGNNLGIPGPALEDTLLGLEEDTKEETGVDVRFPLDVKGAEVLLVTPSADFFSEPHVESLIGYAKVFHAAGISWTLSSHASRGRQLRAVHRQLRADAQHLAARARGRARTGRQAHHRRRVRPRLARGLQLLEHADRPLRLPRPALSGAAAHLRIHLRPDPARRAEVRQGKERRPHHHLPRLVQRGACLAHGHRCPAGSS